MTLELGTINITVHVNVNMLTVKVGVESICTCRWEENVGVEGTHIYVIGEDRCGLRHMTPKLCTKIWASRGHIYT